MILHFKSNEPMPGESKYLNICTDPENYNFNIYTEDNIHYIEVSADDLRRIYAELDFNCYWHQDDLTAEHDIEAAILAAAIDRQAEEAEREDLTEDEIINNRFR